MMFKSITANKAGASAVQPSFKSLTSSHWGFFIYGSITGFLAWGGEGITPLLVLLVLPVLYGVASTRLAGWLLLLGYYLAGARGLPGGAAVFFGEGASYWKGVILWAGACLLLSVPFAAAWSQNKHNRGWRFILSLILITLPPLGVIGWENPLAIAGLLFPGVGWAGLALTVWLFILLATWGPQSYSATRFIFFCVWVSIIANLFAKSPPTPTGWRGEDTAFAKLAGDKGDDAGLLLASMARVTWVKQYAKTIPAHTVAVLPETILGTFDGLTESTLLDANDALVKRESSLLVGAELPQPDGHFKNVLMVLGVDGFSKRNYAVQGIPVPVAMWLPGSSEGASADLFSKHSAVMVQGVRVDVAICYEQLLAWSMLTRMWNKPDILIAASNVWWARDTSIPAIEKQTLAVFARLFAIGFVRAENK